MKILKKYQRSIACILLVAFSSYLFSGCSAIESMFYKPVDPEKSNVKRITSTKEKTGEKQYDYKLKQKTRL